MREVGWLDAALTDAAQDRDARVRATGAWRARGVVHTPPALARYVARRCDAVLREQLGLPGGLADSRVALLDPACGPGVFLAAALETAWNAPSVPAVCEGFDVDEAVLVETRRIVGPAMAERGWPLVLRRADTLDLAAAQESRAEFRVILGNPPWAGRSTNRETAVEGLLDDFRRDGAGRPLRERKIGVLSDDYVRFWRWAAEVVRRAPYGGLVALVTNSSFVDGPVHRGMRGALTRWFDGIELLDLGGNSLVGRAKGRDENVFAVRPGAVVTLAWRARGVEPRSAAVAYARLGAGTRAEKLAVLDGAAVTVAWRAQLVECEAPLFLFRTTARDATYATWFSLADLMPFHREGIQTNRDAIVIDADRGRLVDRLEAFARGEARSDLGAALERSRHYDPEVARRAVRSALDAWTSRAHVPGWLRPIAYRPFDVRWLAAIPGLCHRPRPDLVQAVGRSSWVLLTVRKDRGDRPFRHFGVVRDAPDSSWLSSRSACRTRAFPSHAPDGEANLDRAVLGPWEDRVGRAIEVEEFMAYALVHLASPAYSDRFVDDLALDFARIPPPGDTSSFSELVRAGRRVADAFLSNANCASGSANCIVGHRRVRHAQLAEALSLADARVRAVLRLGS